MEANLQETDVLILGAGPAGATTSLFLGKEKISHVIIDKAVFPRDKICGDAISGKVVDVLKKYDEKIHAELHVLDRQFLPSWGVTFVAPNGKSIEIPFTKNVIPGLPASGYVVRRFDFDHFLFSKIDRNYAQVFEETIVEKVYRSTGRVVVEAKRGQEKMVFKAKVVVGAEGDRSFIASELAHHRMHPENYCAGLRAYYDGVEGLSTKGFIELHFIKNVLPGYFWIFPMPNGKANVGIGMLSSAISKKKVNLKKVLEDVVTNHPVISKRFTNAKLEGSVKGWGLPLGSVKRSISGDRFLLTGDAASLIDPFTGEGIGNAMKSGMIAASVIKEALIANDFSAVQLKKYDEEVYRRMWSELKLSHTMQKLTNYSFLFNAVVNKAQKNKELRDTISCMFYDLDVRKKLSDPMFYLRILF